MKINTRIKQISDVIAGTNHEPSIEKKLYIGTVLIIIAILFPIMISNYFAGLDKWVNYVVLFFAIPVLSILYYMARFRDYYPVGYLVAAFLLFVSASWFVNGGANGTVPVIYIVCSLAIIGIAKPKYHYLIFLIFFLHLFIMLVLEKYVIGDLIVPYPSDYAHYLDMIFSYGVCMLIVFWILRFYKQAYMAENEKLEIQKRELEKNIALKNMYFTIMVHDLKGSFNNILGFTDLMTNAKKLPSREKAEKFAELTHLSAQQSYELLESILEWSRIQQETFQLKAEKINLFSTVSNIVKESSLQASQKEITILNEIEENNWVKSDPYYIETIFRNLINNAIKFTQHGGEVRISCSDYTYSEYAVSVTDTGIGMDEYWVNNIFNLDFDSKRTGTEGEKSHGIGLKICKELTQKQGSTIWVESSPGKGSTFIFTIPKHL